MALVPDKIKDQIWLSKFIDFGILLKSAKELSNLVDQGTTWELYFKNGQFLVAPSRVTSTKLNIEQWSSAFIIFMAVFLERHPNRSQEILKNFQDVKIAASRSITWWKYDQQFQSKPTS